MFLHALYRYYLLQQEQKKIRKLLCSSNLFLKLKCYNRVHGEKVVNVFL